MQATNRRFFGLIAMTSSFGWTVCLPEGITR